MAIRAGLLIGCVQPAKRWMRQTRLLLQSLQLALTLHDVLVVPLDLDRLFEPPLEIPGGDLIVRRVPGFSGLEIPFGRKTRLVERLAAPKHQSDAVLELAVA